MTVNKRVSEAEEDASGYQMRRSPFVTRQMAKGKRFDRRRDTKPSADMKDVFQKIGTGIDIAVTSSNTSKK